MCILYIPSTALCSLGCYEQSLDPQGEVVVPTVAVKSLYRSQNNQRNNLEITLHARKQFYRRSN